MADNKQLPAVKVGNQWRFPRREIETWLKTQIENNQTGTNPKRSLPSTAHADELFPLECVQMILDGFATALEVTIALTDLEGNLLLPPSNPCGLLQSGPNDLQPNLHERCLKLWAPLIREPTFSPRFMETPLGLLCARGLVRVKGEVRAMVVLGGISPPEWPPPPEELHQTALQLQVPPEQLQQNITKVHYLDDEAKKKVLPFAQGIADILSHIARERSRILESFRQIHSQISPFLNGQI